MDTGSVTASGQIGAVLTTYFQAAVKEDGIRTWVEGAPEKVGWLFQQVEAPPDKCVPVGVFRSSACGFLESYARPEFAAE